MLQYDCSRRFFFENLGVRGQWVKLIHSWQTAKQFQHGPVVAEHQLGQALSAAVLLASTIKFNGSLIIQAQGDGPLKTLVAQSTHDRKIRGLVRCDSDISDAKLNDLFGIGRLVLTISSEDTAPYQGIVPLAGNTLAIALESYFVQSEQLNTRLWLAADQSQTAGLLIQQLPPMTDGQDWEHIQQLANTLTDKELLDLDCETLLYRLFNEENVRLFDAEPVEFVCSCSRSKIENTLRLLGRVEIESILAEFGKIEVNCEFCNQHYLFDKIDTQNLLLNLKNVQNNSQYTH